MNPKVLLASLILTGVTLLALWPRKASSRLGLVPDLAGGTFRLAAQPEWTSTGDYQIPSPTAGYPLVRWPHIETNDLRAYVARLRTMECPECTVRDIIIGVIQRRFEPRLAALRRAAAEPFYQTLDRHGLYREQEAQQRESALDNLERERNALVHDLLGIDFEDYQPERPGKPDHITKLLDNLSEDARSRARPILREYQRLESAVFQRCGGTLGLPEQSELDQLYGRKIDALRGVLSARDLDEFELRESPLAHRLRTADLIGFAPTEEEFRQIFHIAKETESDEPSSAEQSSLTREARLRQVLGEQRFADYTRSQDLTYRRLVEFASHFGFGSDTAAQVHDMREAVIQQVDALQGNARLTDASRVETLRAIQAESAQAVRALLGDEACDKYLDTQLGRWINLIPTWTNGIVFRD